MATPRVYQRVGNTAVTPADYDFSVGRLALVCDGIDDGMVTGTITPGTDKAQVFAGVRKIGNETSILCELGTSSSAFDGSFHMAAPDNTGANDYGFANRGTVRVKAVSPANYAPPITNVFTGLGDIGGDLATLRVNGTQAASSTADQGTGNYLAYPLYLFRRGGTSLPFNGHFYGAVIRFGDNLPIETIQQTEAYMNSKTQAIDWRDITDSSSFRWNSATASPDAE